MLPLPLPLPLPPAPATVTAVTRADTPPASGCAPTGTRAGSTGLSARAMALRSVVTSRDHARPPGEAFFYTLSHAER